MSARVARPAACQPHGRDPMCSTVRVHGSCVARDGVGVLLTGSSGSGKSDLALRLIRQGFMLVADDQVLIEAGEAAAPETLAGLLEVRGLGLVRVRHLARARLALLVELTGEVERLPAPRTMLGLPALRLDPRAPSAPDRVGLALDCLAEPGRLLAGAFAL